MGKQSIDRLLSKLKGNQEEDVHNAASIFTVAQSAVNQLTQLGQTDDTEPKALSDAPPELTKADLIERYGNYNNCRKAAKQLGITFSRTPRWAQMIAAFRYLPACQSCVNAYVQRHPHPDLKGTKIQLMLDSEP